MSIYAVDPGTEQSAIVMLDAGKVVGHAIHPNETLLQVLADYSHRGDTLVVEAIESYGMAVGAETFRTVWYAGRFHQAWQGPAYQLSRRAVKLHLCSSARATDANIRTAILDRFGPGTEKAIGKKAAPGPLYGLKGHEFAALAVALTWADTHP